MLSGCNSRGATTANGHFSPALGSMPTSFRAGGVGSSARAGPGQGLQAQSLMISPHLTAAQVSKALQHVQSSSVGHGVALLMGIDQSAATPAHPLALVAGSMMANAGSPGLGATAPATGNTIAALRSLPPPQLQQQQQQQQQQPQNTNARTVSPALPAATAGSVVFSLDGDENAVPLARAKTVGLVNNKNSNNAELGFECATVCTLC